MTWTGLYSNGIRVGVTDGTEIISAPTSVVETQVVTPVVSLPMGMSEEGWELTPAPPEQRLAQRTVITSDPRWETVSDGIPLEEPIPFDLAMAKRTAAQAVFAWWAQFINTGITVAGITLPCEASQASLLKGRLKDFRADVAAAISESLPPPATFKVYDIAGFPREIPLAEVEAAASAYESARSSMEEKYDAAMLGIDAATTQAEIDTALEALA